LCDRKDIKPTKAVPDIAKDSILEKWTKKTKHEQAGKRPLQWRYVDYIFIQQF